MINNYYVCMYINIFCTLTSLVLLIIRICYVIKIICSFIMLLCSLNGGDVQAAALVFSDSSDGSIDASNSRANQPSLV